MRRFTLSLIWLLLLTSAGCWMNGTTVISDAPPSSLTENVQATAISLARNGSSLCTIGEELNWIDSQTHAVRSRFSIEAPGTLRFLGLSGDGNSVLIVRYTTNSASHLELWTYADEKVSLAWRSKNDPIDYDIHATAMLPNSILISTYDHILSLDMKGHLRKQVHIASFDPRRTGFSPNGQFLWASDSLLDVQTGKELGKYPVGAFRHAFSPSSRWLYVSYIDMLNEENYFILDTKTRMELKGDAASQAFGIGFGPTNGVIVDYAPMTFVDPVSGKKTVSPMPAPFASQKDQIVVDLQFSTDGHTSAALSDKGLVWLHQIAPSTSGKSRPDINISLRIGAQHPEFSSVTQPRTMNTLNGSFRLVHFFAPTVLMQD